MNDAHLKIMPVAQCDAVGKCQSHPSGYEHACSSRYTFTKPTPQRIAEYALQQLETARTEDIATHEANAAAIANNQAIVARVTELMTAIGMPGRWSERDRHSRARYPKSITHVAGWITDLGREVRTDDGFSLATSTYERLKASYDEYAAQAKKQTEAQERERERAKQAELDKRKADMELASMLLRYELPIESSWADVLQALRGRHQRLDLAVAMAQTRGDWSSGPYRVRDALERFSIQDDEDKAIAADVASCLYDFEDGRVFRDTTWSYGALFASVADQQLSADVQRALQLAGGDD